MFPAQWIAAHPSCVLPHHTQPALRSQPGGVMLHNEALGQQTLSYQWWMLANLNLTQAGSEAIMEAAMVSASPAPSQPYQLFSNSLAHLPPQPSHHAPLVWEPKLLLLISARPTHQHPAAPSPPLHLTQEAESNPTVLGFHTLVPACNAASAHRCGGSSLPSGERSKQQERLLHQGDLILFIWEPIRDGLRPPML